MSTKIRELDDSEADAVNAKIVADRYVEICRIDSGIDWAEKVHAVNWFNTRSLLVYNFYNLIASRSVANVGGKPLFKGTLIKQILGSAEDKRTVLLLVRYPSPVHFRSMLENNYFKLVSLFRTLAVRDFSFCLTKASTVSEFTALANDSQSYLIHHFRGNQQAIELAKQLAASASLELVFTSLKSHRLGTGDGKGVVTPVPDLMDGVLLYRASDADVLENFVTSAGYQEVLASTDSSFVGSLQRIM